MDRPIEHERIPDRGLYQLCLDSQLAPDWADWFGATEVRHSDGGHTILLCPVADQAELHGLLRKVRDLGLPLLSVTRMDGSDPSALSGSSKPA